MLTVIDQIYPYLNPVVNRWLFEIIRSIHYLNGGIVRNFPTKILKSNGDFEVAFTYISLNFVIKESKSFL
jgi:hypothetical protein